MDSISCSPMVIQIKKSLNTMIWWYFNMTLTIRRIQFRKNNNFRLMSATLLVKDLLNSMALNILLERQRQLCVSSGWCTFRSFKILTFLFFSRNRPLDIASGTTVDWAFNAFDIPIGYTFEFRGGSYGFVLPADQILPNCYETRDGIIAMVGRARELGYMNVRT